MTEGWLNNVVGKSWQAYATGPEYFDCWGLVVFGFKQRFGIDLNRHLEVPTLSPVAFHKVVSKEIKTGNWIQITRPEDGCLVLMSASRLWHHVGLWLDVNGGRLLHSREGVGVSLDGKHVLNSFNAVEYWKYVPVTDSASSI